jgi:hypothetical protein
VTVLCEPMLDSPKHPALSAGQQNLYFNLRAIVGWLLIAVMHASIILAAVVVGADPTEVDRPSGHTTSLGQNGILMFSIVIITVHAQLGCCIDHWTWMHHASCWGSISELGGGGMERGWRAVKPDCPPPPHRAQPPPLLIPTACPPPQRSGLSSCWRTAPSP